MLPASDSEHPTGAIRPRMSTGGQMEATAKLTDIKGKTHKAKKKKKKATNKEPPTQNRPGGQSCKTNEAT